MTQTKTVGKYLTNEGAIASYFDKDYTDGYAYGEGNSNVFYQGDILYSYGKHFPMVVRHGRHYFVNADNYSKSTAKHQSYVQRMCPKGAKIEIPFSALERAGILVKDIEVIDRQQSKYIEVEKKVDGEIQVQQVHLMGDTLFKVNGNYFISGIDETAKDLWKGFFLTQLVGEPETIEEALESMKPVAVKVAEMNGEEVLRQGEYFFIKATNDLGLLDELKEAEKAKTVQKKVALKHKTADTNRANNWEFRESRHVVTSCMELYGEQYAKGTCRHVAGEHKMLKLDGWYRVAENVQVQSWSANGRVD